MLRTALVLLALALGSLAPLSAQTSPDCATGRARGAWDLPTRAGDGHVRGILADGSGRRWALEGLLTLEAPDGGLRGGRLTGLLMPLRADGSLGKPLAEVHGHWIVALERSGRFETAIYPLQEAPDERPEPIGKLAGAFSDPMVDGGDAVGRFSGRWAVCR